MKKLLFIITVIFLVSCGKDDSTTALKCKLARITRVNGGVSDTSFFTYTGDNLHVKYTYSNSSSIYDYDYIKSGSQYTYVRYSNGVQSIDGFFTINAQGFFDTSRIIHVPAMTINNTSKFYYSPDNYLIRGVTNYVTYENDVKYHYNSDGNYSYWIYDQFNFSVPSSSTKDSVVFEYYLTKPKLAEKYGFESKYGKLEKNLFKKWSFYNLLAGNVLRKTYEYEYLTDANGYVTRQVFISKNQPGDVVTGTDTTYYQYICD